MTDFNAFILICFLLLFLIAFGLALYSAGKSRTIPNWLKWWQPMTRRVGALAIDDQYTKEDRILIDGVGIAALGSYMAASFLLLLALIEYLSVSKNIGLIIYVIVSAMGFKLQEWTTYKLVENIFRK